MTTPTPRDREPSIFLMSLFVYLAFVKRIAKLFEPIIRDAEEMARNHHSKRVTDDHQHHPSHK